MSDTTTTKPRHEVLRERLVFFGFVADEPRGGDTAEYWKLGGITCALAIDTTKGDYARYCDRVACRGATARARVDRTPVDPEEWLEEARSNPPPLR